MSKFHRGRHTREPSSAPQRAKLTEVAPVRSGSLRQLPPGAIVQRAMAAPQLLRPDDLMTMQRTLGNRAVGAMVGRVPVQAKLIVNAPDDEYEREAARVADDVMRAPAMRREETPGPENSPVAMTRPASAHGGDGSFAAGEGFTQRLQARQGRGRPLPPALRDTFETRMSADFSGVRVHSDAEAGQLNQAIQAEAFTWGSDIFLGAGQSAATTAGQRLLAHELTHVIQQGVAPPKTPTGPREITPPAGSRVAGHIQREKGDKTGDKATPSPQEVLTGLASPKVFELSDKVIRTELKVVEELERLVQQRKTPQFTTRQFSPAPLFCLGGIELSDDLTVSDKKLTKDAKLIHMTPSKGIDDGYEAIANNATLKKRIVNVVMNTLISAGQIEYLTKSGLTNSLEWKILIEVHYYRDRNVQTYPSFHKDTQGETLFVNLNFINPEKMAGPEYILNPLLVESYEEFLENSLHPTFRAHLSDVRKGLKPPTEIKATEVPRHGVVSFVDELIHHKSPLYGLRTVSNVDVEEFLREKFPIEYEEAERTAALRVKYKGWKSSESEVNWAKLIELATTKGEYDRTQLKKGGLGQHLIDELIDRRSHKGFREINLPHSQSAPIRASGRPPLKREMSSQALVTEPEGARRFSGLGYEQFGRTPEEIRKATKSLGYDRY